MPAALISRAQYLRNNELNETALDAAVQATWGDASVEVSHSSRLTTQAAASAEAARQRSITNKARASDTVVLEGVFFGLEGKRITITYPALGYDGGKTVDVVSCAPDMEANETVLGVLVTL